MHALLAASKLFLLLSYASLNNEHQILLTMLLLLLLFPPQAPCPAALQGRSGCCCRMPATWAPSSSRQQGVDLPPPGEISFNCVPAVHELNGCENASEQDAMPNTARCHKGLNPEG
jgi:hypothetical protein